MSISPDQKNSEQVDCTVLNLRNGELFSPTLLSSPTIHLTEAGNGNITLDSKRLTKQRDCQQTPNQYSHGKHSQTKLTTQTGSTEFHRGYQQRDRIRAIEIIRICRHFC